MPLQAPTDDDLRKIHAEVGQLVNQRFLLTTLAITIFGVAVAWMLPKSATVSGDSADLVFLGAVILLMLLFGLYVLHHSLLAVLRVFTTYLVETKKSNWEVDWRAFRKKGHFFYTKAQTIVFLILNLLAIVSPFLVSYIFSLKKECYLVVIVVAIGSVTTSVMFLCGFFGLFDFEAKAAARWKELNT